MFAGLGFGRQHRHHSDNEVLDRNPYAAGSPPWYEWENARLRRSMH